MGKGKERGDKLSGYMAGTTQQKEMDKSAKLTEDGKRDLDFPLFNGSRDLHYNLKAYLDKLVSLLKSEDLKMKLFIRTLIGSTLRWYAKKDTKEWVSWNYLANSFWSSTTTN
ncbi:hypothetical protein HAX54_016978 [Datura stramonium]|uniref:Uncharacterized protein n=1 Tax=Datura stramonium TaxID=4076 RepID=A0ABS8UM05_DATST|nr:hypothetical protein [Datura stramonium]